jgi:two-component system, NtrC family, response regulator AlgB
MDATSSVLIIDDDPGIRQSVRVCLESDGARVLGVGSGSAALELLERSRFDLVFLDLWLGSDSGLEVLPEILRRQPGIGVVVITAFASFETAVEAIKLGAVDYLPKPFTPQQVRYAAERVVEANILKRQVAELQDRIDATEADSCFDTRNAPYAAFLETVRRAAGSETVLLLRGESGTGKNVLAYWIRKHSKRSQGPLVTVHCPMLSGDLMTSTLFGHRRGAFTGAVADSVGKVEVATGGTLFLDEIADLTPDAQARFLRFMNDRTYERLGEARERKADVRVIAASNRPLEDLVRSGQFREDLFFRLNVITLVVPPLRDRREDILPLAQHYLRFFSRQQGRQNLSLSDRCHAALLNYNWPGNLRELRNAVERAVILAPSGVLEPEDLGFRDRNALPARTEASALLGADVSLEELEREHIARVLANATSLENAARVLGIDATTLHRKRKRFGLA